jgi:hypothetical protein
MYIFNLKNSLPDIEKMMDELIAKPLIIIKEPKSARRLGIYAKSLREQKILNISQDPKTRETVAYLKYNNILRPGKVKKNNGKRKIEYIFDDLLIPKDLY